MHYYYKKKAIRTILHLMQFDFSRLTCSKPFKCINELGAKPLYNSQNLLLVIVFYNSLVMMFYIVNIYETSDGKNSTTSSPCIITTALLWIRPAHHLHSVIHVKTTLRGVVTGFWWFFPPCSQPVQQPFSSDMGEKMEENHICIKIRLAKQQSDGEGLCWKCHPPETRLGLYL